MSTRLFKSTLHLVISTPYPYQTFDRALVVFSEIVNDVVCLPGTLVFRLRLIQGYLPYSCNSCIQ